MTVRAVFRVDLDHPAPVVHSKVAAGILPFEAERAGVRIAVVPEVTDQVEIFEADGEEVP